jgi:hypothetical protein
VRKRRIGLVLVALVLLITACGNDDDASDNENGSAADLQLSGASTSVTVDENRFVLTLWDGENRVADATSIKLTVRDREAEDEPIIWQGTMSNYSDYEVPYWVAYPEFSRPGVWVLDVEVERENGASFETNLAINVWDAPRGVAVGDDAIPSQNRMWDGTGDLTAISSAEEPNPAYYQMTIAEALREDKPILIAFTTPGFCQTAICAPVMNTIDPLWEHYQDQINFIHVEVIADFETLDWVPEMSEWGLQNEPWIYVIGRDGKVFNRFDGPVSPSELEPVLQHVLANS